MGTPATPDARPPEVLVDRELTVRRYTVADAASADGAYGDGHKRRRAVNP